MDREEAGSLDPVEDGVARGAVAIEGVSVETGYRFRGLRYRDGDVFFDDEADQALRLRGWESYRGDGDGDLWFWHPSAEGVEGVAPTSLGVEADGLVLEPPHDECAFDPNSRQVPRLLNDVLRLIEEIEGMRYNAPKGSAHRAG